jgi:hypothetical protein
MLAQRTAKGHSSSPRLVSLALSLVAGHHVFWPYSSTGGGPVLFVHYRELWLTAPRPQKIIPFTLDPEDGTFAEIVIEHDNLPVFEFTTTWFPFGNLAHSNPNQIPFVILLIYSSDYVSRPFAATLCPLVLIPFWLTIDNNSIVRAVLDHRNHLQDYFGPGILFFQHSHYTCRTRTSH